MASREQLDELGRALAARPTRTPRRPATGRTSADFYTDDATYGWNIGPKEDVMCVGRDEIRDVALGLEMEGLENWNYEYQKVLVDEKQGEIVGFWKQIVNKSDGTRDEIYGIGGSWFRLNDDLLIEWQRDFFDFGHVSYMFGKLIGSGDLSATACRSGSNGPWPARNCLATTRSARRRHRSGDSRPSSCLGVRVTHLTNGSSLASQALAEGTYG